MFKIKLKIKGTERKTIVNVISNILDTLPIYMAAPTFSYQIDEWILDNQCFLSSPFLKISEIYKIKKVIDGLSLTNFETEGNLEIVMNEKFDENLIQKLNSLINSKKNLISQSLEIQEESLKIKTTETDILFNFIEATFDFEKIKAYITLFSKLYEEAKKLKYCSAKPKEVSNPKYAFRCFLLRLGFIGPDFKNTRKILLQNLSGNSAFKNKSS